VYDLLFRGCRLIDGSGSPAVRSDARAGGGRTAAVGRALGPARETIDAAGRVLAPGFIDSHSHNDLILERDPRLIGAVEQGITTLIGGNCGESAAPLSPARLRDTLRVCGAEHCADPAARYDFGAWRRGLPPLGANAAFLIGHGNLRAAAMGFADRAPTDGELAEMERLLRACMAGGALGVSFGLIYPPGIFAQTAELTALARVAAACGGLCSVHMRSENTRRTPAWREMMTVARESGCRTVISHHKATGGPSCWGQTAETLRLMDAENAAGGDVFCDQYPYTASSTGLSTFLPDRVLSRSEDELTALVASPEGRAALRDEILGGKTPQERLQYTMISSSQSRPDLNGRMLCEAAAEAGLDPYALLMDLLAGDRLQTGAVFHTMCEEDVERVMRWDRAMVGTDGITLEEGPGGHPRARATFPRVLGRYVRERGVLTLENAVRKMTSLPALVYSLGHKGLVRPGMDADLVLFDPDTVCDGADYASPRRRGTGIDRVYVGGVCAVENGVFTGRCAGKALGRDCT